MLNMQMVTYGQPLFWMIDILDHNSPEELQEEIFEVCVWTAGTTNGKQQRQASRFTHQFST